MDYLIYNAARSPHTKGVRVASPQRRGLAQFVCNNQFRLVRNRSVRVSEDVLRKHLDELRKKAASGYILVKTTDGRVVDLATFEPGPAPIKEGPAPNPPLDLLENDPRHEQLFEPPKYAGEAPAPEGVEDLMVGEEEPEEDGPPAAQQPAQGHGKKGKQGRR